MNTTLSRLKLNQFSEQRIVIHIYEFAKSETKTEDFDHEAHRLKITFVTYIAIYSPYLWRMMR